MEMVPGAAMPGDTNMALVLMLIGTMGSGD